MDVNGVLSPLVGLGIALSGFGGKFGTVWWWLLFIFICMFLGLRLLVTSFIFWKLDSRSSQASFAILDRETPSLWFLATLQQFLVSLHFLRHTLPFILFSYPLILQNHRVHLIWYSFCHRLHLLRRALSFCLTTWSQSTFHYR